MDEKDINLRSEEVQEILGGVPAWILRWGISLLALLIIILLVGSAFFKYPDMVPTSMTLTGTVAVGKVQAKTSGRIQELWVANNEEVPQGAYLAILENGAVTKDVMALKKYLSTLHSDETSSLPFPPLDWNLGDMQQTYIQLYTLPANENTSNKKDIFHHQLQVILMQLQAQLQAWEKDYVLMAPISGNITFTNYWAVNQLVSAGNIVFQILPVDPGEIIGKAVLPMSFSGKVRAGQKVNVHFDNFPDNEYGVVKGIVRNISRLPSEGNYIVDIAFPQGLVTTYKRELPFMAEMHARADIVTQDISLLERLFMPMKKLWSGKE